jgi:hypothetical protein
MKKSITILLMAIVAFVSYAVEPSGTLPVVYINIPEHTLDDVHNDKDTYVSAEMWIEDATGTYTNGSAEKPMTFQMKGRGNYTWSGFDKKPYRVKFDKKQSVLGLNSSKHFGLLAQADDSRGFCRNALGYKTSETVGLAWTTKQVPCELVINNEYRGLYFFTELIKNAKDRVNVKDGYEKSVVEAGTETIPDDYYTGGWIIEVDNYDTSPHVTVTEPNTGYAVWLTYDKMVDEATEAQENFLTSEFNTIQSLIYGDKENDDALWEILDLDAAAKFYVVQEFTDNKESYHGSCYLYRERGAGEKWYFGPVWDFGASLGYTKTSAMSNSEFHQVWIAELLKHPKFKARAKEIYNELIENVTDIQSFITDFCASITEAAKKDRERWPSYGNDMTGKATEVNDFITSSIRWAKIYGYADSDEVNPTIPDTNYVVPEISNGVYEAYFDPTDTGWEEVFAYVFGNKGTVLGAWPGSYCYKVVIDGKEYWHITVNLDSETDDEYIIFNNNTSNQVGSTQTENLKLVHHGVYTLDMGSNAAPTVTLEPTVVEPTEPTEPTDYTVYFYDTTGSWPQVYIWIWEDGNGYTNYTGGTWPGEAMTRRTENARAAITSATAVWEHTINTTEDPSDKKLKVVFSGYDGNGTGEENKIAQTADLDYVPGNSYNANGQGTGAVTISLDNCGLKAVGGKGVIAITTDCDAEVMVATIDGKSNSVKVSAGVTLIPCQRGIYLVRSGAKATKVAVD